VGHEGHFAVLYGDCPLLAGETLERLVAAQAASDAAATVITTTLPDPTGYGRIIRDTTEAGTVLAIVEEKAATPQQREILEINSGIYCFRSELLWEHIDALWPNPASGEYYLTDVVELFRTAGLRVRAMHLGDPTEVLGINSRVELAGIDRIFRRRKAEELMLSGVTIEYPETVTIDGEAEIGMDTVVEPFARILGRSRIGSNCRIGAHAILESATLGKDVEVAPFTLINHCVIERGARIGPFARLRVDSHVGEGARVGNFVELKKTRLGAGAKSMHLAYLGDSTIGRGVNVGAGTITCNYDGVKKHETHIEEGVFVGSNATLVAPLRLGPNSYVGAGSVITEDVPAGALALGRSRQVTKEDWVRRRKENQGRE
jgi:bifunctional UDP-N-acetylglucosamine pyrophosphorylase/glucosamine-1-phosphate N-acetyltransferase